MYMISSTKEINQTQNKKIGHNNGNMMNSGKVKCVEKHQRANPSYFSKNRSACKWGRKNVNVQTCGDCPFGIQLLQITPAYRTYLTNWEAILNLWNWPAENLNKISPLIKK